MARKRRADDRGVAMIEAAIVLPLLVVLAFGVLEFGNAWRQANVVERASHNAGRTAGNVANGRYADYETLRSISSQIGGLNDTALEKVIVYRATDADGSVPAGCLTIAPAAGGAGDSNLDCNVYSPAQVATGSLTGFGSDSNGDCSGGSWDRFWCPTGRERDFNPLPDRVGVYVRLQYQPITGVFPGALTIERRAVFQVEPCSAGEVQC